MVKPTLRQGSAKWLSRDFVFNKLWACECRNPSRGLCFCCSLDHPCIKGRADQSCRLTTTPSMTKSVLTEDTVSNDHFTKSANALLQLMKMQHRDSFSYMARMPPSILTIQKRPCQFAHFFLPKHISYA